MCVHYSRVCKLNIIMHITLVVYMHTTKASTPRSNIILLYVLVVRALCILCIVS